MTTASRRTLGVLSVAALSIHGFAREALAFPAPVQANPAGEMTAALMKNYAQVQSFSRTLFYDPNQPLNDYPRLYWFKYTSDGNTRVKFDTLGSQIQTFQGGGVALGSSNQTQIAVYDAAGGKRAITGGTVGRDGNPIAMYPTYEPTYNTNSWYYAQGLSELYLQPGSPGSPRWNVDPHDPTPYTGWSAPGNEGNSQRYYAPYYPTNLNEYQVWNTALSHVILDNDGNPVINPSTGQPRAQPGWRYYDRARVGPGASWNQYDVLPAGDYYVAISSSTPAFAGDTYREELLRAPITYNPDTGQVDQPVLTAPMGPFQYYLSANPYDFYGTIDLNVTTLPIADPTWQTNANGVWSAQPNWSAAVPTVPGAVAKFTNAITAARTITVDGDHTVGTIVFDNAASSYTLAGTGTIRVEGWFNEARINVLSGSHTISAPLLLASASSEINVQQAGSLLTLTSLLPSVRPLTKTGAGKLAINTINAPLLEIQAGTVRLTTRAVAGKVTRLSVSSPALLDVGSSGLVLDYSAETSPQDTIRLMIAAGRITSTDPNLTVGYGEASVLHLTSFLGQTGLDSTALLIRGTRPGDFDLSGTVDFADLVALAQHYNSTNAVWTSGDVDYDADVDFNDLVKLAQNYNQSALSGVPANLGTAEFQSDFALAQSLVPEPVSLGVLGSVLLLRRRSR